MTKVSDIDAIMTKVRAKSLELIAKSEERFVEDVLVSGAMTFDEAMNVLRDHRETVLQDSMEESMTKVRAWLERGCTDLH
ncbi:MULTISPECIES: hypothetical protein [Bradyrhizobium]|uniref:hypothetical protein n=1 Tax=Bradyrhizobium elkanii TaxID=29448 RepID=UPI002714AE6B|nr:hypothetical protein [Bradyrhizobium elkanii]WLA47293.1 hypothetical protein QIH80_37320 [Bradyrhizobium elkanii]WLB82411.1 hypothetical protein QIH83_07455 [Bradyrhizobium elkanii]